MEEQQLPEGAESPKGSRKVGLLMFQLSPRGIQTIFGPRHLAPQRAVACSRRSPYPHGAARPCQQAIPDEPNSGSSSLGLAGISLVPLLVWSHKVWIRALLAQIPSWPVFLGSLSL